MSNDLTDSNYVEPEMVKHDDAYRDLVSAEQFLEQFDELDHKFSEIFSNLKEKVTLVAENNKSQKIS